MEEKRTLKKQLGVWSAMSIVVGCVIGAGVFFKPQAIYQATGGAPGMGMLSWIIGGLASIFAALTFAEVAILKPKTGGMITYLGETYGEKVGYLAGWMQVVIFYPAFVAGYGVKVGEVLSEAIGLDWTRLPISILTIIILVAVNTLSVKATSGVQVVSTACKLIPLVLIMIFGLVLGTGDNPVFTPMVGETTNAGAALSSCLIAVLFAFEGWTNVGTLAGEMKNPGRDLPRAIVGGVSVIMAVYFIINMAYLWVLPAEALRDAAAAGPAAAVAEKIFGSFGGTLIKIGIVISVIGAGNGFLMSGARVAYQMAEDKTLPCSKTLAKLNSNCVPANSVILIGFLACLFSITGQFDMLTNLAVFSSWIFYTLTFACVMTLRRKEPNAVRKYKVPLYPVIPILAIVSGVYVMISQLFLSGSGSTWLSIGSIAITLVGLPVYLAVKKYYAKAQPAQKSENQTTKQQ